MEPKFKFVPKFQETADPKSLTLLERIALGIGSLTNAVRSIRIDFPRIYTVNGEVSVDRVRQLPPVEVTNFPDLKEDFRNVIRNLNTLQEETVKAVTKIKIESPDSVKVGNQVEIKYWNDLIDGIEELKKGFNLLLKKDFSSGVDGIQKVELTNYRQMVPTPVTKIDINPLRGEATSTLVSVGTTATPLPSVPLAKRRSFVVFNNDASKVLYLGGSDVTASGSKTGLPILAQTYSPTIDAGPQMTIYGISGSGSINTIVFEISNDYGTTSTSLGNI